MESIYKLQSDLCKIFVNDKRLEIINLLKDKERSNKEIMHETGLSKVNISQHMNVLKSKGVVVSRCEGQQLFYSIANPKIVKACTLMQEVLIEQHSKNKRDISRLFKLFNDMPRNKSVNSKTDVKRKQKL